ncbi:MAG: hypothetical protein PHI78_02730 [Clostridia bacterium]|nr:hypothetical protein [Clostridia bacterium]
MKKRIVTTVIAVIFLLATLLTFTACSPYETVQSLTQKMEETQKYTMGIVMDMTMSYNEQEVHCLADATLKTDVDKIYVSYEFAYDEEYEANISAESYIYLDGNTHKLMVREDESEEWSIYETSSSDNGLGVLANYITIDFNWDKFTEDYFDQDGNTLVLKEDKYDEFFPSSIAEYLNYFKVTAGFNQLSIEYSMSYNLYITTNIVVTMSITDIGTTTVTIPE